LLILLLFFSHVDADVYNDFSKHLKNKDYTNACRVGKKIIYSKEENEKLISKAAKVCLKSDFIYGLSVAQFKLRKTKEGRADAVAFSSIVLQKKLIYQFMYDNTDISSFALPIVNHPLSHTFVAIRDRSYTLVSANPKVIEFKKDDKKYKVFVDKADKGRVIIEITDSNNKKERRRYI
jgi:hypothetical protein